MQKNPNSNYISLVEVLLVLLNRSKNEALQLSNHL